MLRKLVVGGAVFVIGYMAGLLFGYRAAVVDYVENDAQTLRSMAETMYPSPDEEAIPEKVREAMQEAKEGSDGGESESSPGFQ